MGEHSEILKNEQFSVDTAGHPDIDGILVVQNENLRSSLNERGIKDEDLPERGFLISPLSAEELTEIISEPESHLLLVARSEEKIEGYALGYDLDKWKKEDPMWEKQLVFRKRKTLPLGKTLYFRHVAVAPEIKGRGVGRMMEHDFFEEAKRRGYQYIIGEILRDPVVNKRSMDVHKTSGFEVIGENFEEGMVWDVVLKNLEK